MEVIWVETPLARFSYLVYRSILYAIVHGIGTLEFL